MKSYWNYTKDLKVMCIIAYTEKINKISLSSNDDKKFQSFDRITSYLYGTSVGKVCKTELLRKYKWLILMIIQMKMKQNII